MELHLHMVQEVALVTHHLTQRHRTLQVEATSQRHQPLQVEIVEPHQVFLLHQNHQTLREADTTPPLQPQEAVPQHQSL